MSDRETFLVRLDDAIECAMRHGTDGDRHADATRRSDMRENRRLAIALFDELAAIAQKYRLIVVVGKDARRIQDEIENGTPDTAQRIETIRRSDEAYAPTAAARALELHRKFTQERIAGTPPAGLHHDAEPK